MTVERCIPLESADDWRDVLDAVPHGFTHTWEHCHAMHLTSGLPTFLYVLERAQARLVCPIVERHWGGSISIATPAGISGFTANEDVPGFVDHWNGFVRRKGYVAGYIGLNPLFHRPSFGAADAYNVTHVLNLQLSMDELLGRADRNRRREFRAYEVSRANIIDDRTRLVSFLDAHYSSVMDRIGMPAVHRWSRETVTSLATGPKNLLIGFEVEGHVTAALLSGFTPFAADLILNVALPEGVEHTPLLTWHSVVRFKEKRIPVLNLGGGARPDDAIAKAKQRYGGERQPLSALRQVYDAPKYAALCQRAGVDPDGPWFPAFLMTPDPGPSH